MLHCYTSAGPICGPGGPMYLGFNDWKISIAISTVRIVQVTRLHYDNGQDLENDTQEVENNNPPDYATPGRFKFKRQKFENCCQIISYTPM